MIKLHFLRFLFFFAQIDTVFSVVSCEILFQRKNDLYIAQTTALKNAYVAIKRSNSTFLWKNDQRLAKSMKCEILFVSIDI